MGIKHLQKFFDENIPNTKGIQTISVNLLTNKAVAVDISIYLYQYACAIKNSVDEIRNQDGEVITHIQAILSKSLGMIKKKIKPIFIFDGAPPQLKQDTLTKRSDNKKKAKNKIKQLNKEIDELVSTMSETPTNMDEINMQLDSIKKLQALREQRTSALKQTTSVNKKQMAECIEILDLLGIPTVQSISEADPQCASMVKTNIAYCVASEDMDMLAFGTTRFIRKLTSKNTCILYNLDIILKDLGITYYQFVDVCIMLGCDYTSTIPTIGLGKILPIIKKYGNIENYLINNSHLDISDFDFVGAREHFLESNVVLLDNIEWKVPNYKKLSKLLKEKYSYSMDEIERLSNVLSGGYYSVISGEKTLKQYKKSCTEYIRQKHNVTMDSDSDSD